MKINVLVCGIDGTQTVEEREVPDDWFTPAPGQSDPQKSDESGTVPGMSDVDRQSATTSADNAESTDEYRQNAMAKS